VVKYIICCGPLVMALWPFWGATCPLRNAALTITPPSHLVNNYRIVVTCNVIVAVMVQGGATESFARRTTKGVKNGRLCYIEEGEVRMGVLRRVFDAHGQLCASRPWEVIIATLTVILCTTSLSLFAASNKICDWNYRCERSHDDDVSIAHIITSSQLTYTSQLDRAYQLGGKSKICQKGARSDRDEYRCNKRYERNKKDVKNAFIISRIKNVCKRDKKRYPLFTCF